MQPAESMNVRFELSDSIYSRAKVQNEQVVYLWLGVSVEVVVYSLGSFPSSSGKDDAVCPRPTLCWSTAAMMLALS